MTKNIRNVFSVGKYKEGSERVREKVRANEREKERERESDRKKQIIVANKET